MNTLFHSSAFTQALGWTVVHSIWQIGCIFLIFKLVGWFLGPRNLMLYRFALLAMAVCTIWSVLTFDSLYRSLQTVAANSVPQNFEWFSIISAPPVELNSRPENTWWTLAHWLDRQSLLFGWFWCIGVIILSLRLLGGYWLTSRLRRRSQPMRDKKVVARGQALSRQIGIERLVKFLENSYISEPMTLGFWKPVVLFPVGLLLQLTPAQIEVLLLHELAHIRRHDYLVNLFQLALEVCFFYHPLFWLMSREARARREYCCDDLVLQQTAQPLLYARTLTAIKITSFHNQNAFAMSATGKNNFTTRIQRILGVAPERAQRSQPVILLFLLVGLAIVTIWPTTSQAKPENNPTIQTTSISPISPVRDSVAPRTIAAKKAAVATKPAPIATPEPLSTPAPVSTPAKKPTRDPAPSLGGRITGSITKQDFLARPEITLLFEQGENPNQFKVVSYELTVVPKDSPDEVITFSCYKAIIREDVLTNISRLSPGSKIYIDDIKVKSTDESEPRNLGGLMFEIKK